MRLSGRTALVTGASRGIGAATARVLLAEGAHVLGVARSGIDIAGIDTFTADLSDPTQLARVVAWMGDRVDILINNAAAFSLARVEDTSPATVDAMLALNVAAPFQLAAAVIPGMRRRGAGDIVTVGSIADHVAFAENGAYAASKFAVRGLHEVLREELRGSGVRSTLVSPAAVDTPLWDAIDRDAHPGLPPRDAMLPVEAVAQAILYAVTQPRGVAIDEIRLSACTST